MRAVTWTQVAQYIIILVAFLLPTMWLSLKHADNPVPQLAYGSVMPKLAAREAELERDPREREVRAIFAQRAGYYQALAASLPSSWENGRQDLERRLDSVRLRNAALGEIRAAERALLAWPKSADNAARSWNAARAANLARSLPPLPHATPFPGVDQAASDIRRNNFLALVFCLMLGTAALPHILMRSYTTASVHGQRVRAQCGLPHSSAIRSHPMDRTERPSHLHSGPPAARDRRLEVLSRVRPGRSRKGRVRPPTRPRS